MTKAEQLYQQITSKIPDSTPAKMFGALALKSNKSGKSGVMFKNDCMVFKLPQAELQEALNLSKAQLFDPSGGRPMKEWAELPYNHADKWPYYAEIAMEYVKDL